MAMEIPVATTRDIIMRKETVSLFTGRRGPGILLLSLLLALGTYPMMLPLFRGHLQTYLSIDDGRFGFLFGVGPLMAAATALAGGSLIERFGVERTIGWCLRGLAVAMIIIALAGSQWLVIAAGLMLYNVFIGPLNIAANVKLVGIFPNHRRQVLALELAVIGAGGMLLPLIGELLLMCSSRFPAVHFSYIFHGPVLVIAVIFGLASSLYRRPEKTVRPRGEAGGGLRSFRLSLPMWGLVILCGMHGASDAALYSWMPKFLDGRSFAVHPLAPGVVLAGFSLAYLVARGLFSLLPERYGRYYFMVLPGILGGTTLWCGIFSGSYWPAVGGYILGGWLWSSEYPTFLGMLAKCDRSRFSTAMALIQVAGGLFTSGAMFGMGQVAVLVGDANLACVLAIPAGGFVLVGLGGLCWLWYCRRPTATPAVGCSGAAPAQ